MADLGTQFNKWWVVMWAISCAALLAMLYEGVTPEQWATSALILFLLPELLGLVHRGDSLPPLTYTVRRYVPRWVPVAITWGIAAWMFYVWCIPVDGMTMAAHPLIVAIAIFGVAGWLTNHWDVTYDGPGE